MVIMKSICDVAFVTETLLGGFCRLEYVAYGFKVRSGFLNASPACSRRFW